jgi:hypothetical protein
MASIRSSGDEYEEEVRTEKIHVVRDVSADASPDRSDTLSSHSVPGIQAPPPTAASASDLSSSDRHVYYTYLQARQESVPSQQSAPHQQSAPRRQYDSDNIHSEIQTVRQTNTRTKLKTVSPTESWVQRHLTWPFSLTATRDRYKPDSPLFTWHKRQETTNRRNRYSSERLAAERRAAEIRVSELRDAEREAERREAAADRRSEMRRRESHQTTTVYERNGQYRRSRERRPYHVVNVERRSTR